MISSIAVGERKTDRSWIWYVGGCYSTTVFARKLKRKLKTEATIRSHSIRLSLARRESFLFSPPSSPQIPCTAFFLRDVGPSPPAENAEKFVQTRCRLKCLNNTADSSLITTDIETMEPLLCCAAHAVTNTFTGLFSFLLAPWHACGACLCCPIAV